ncbi:hypothetical protein [Endozoicomonas montiporae]|uniref:Uncharacterized protein n=1 Tax=Endozoicomonas montiporae CL-33 TaxID=570277 RepID=A0A142BBW9_9GAMM|nr:hypothetical protein [Endozoicomonas montiporae]AMO56245.1 hypothetical protein EZMO1_2133 [Endozoicomonas montiporae CL-33]
MSQLFKHNTSIIRSLGDCADNADPQPSLTLWENHDRQLSCYYAPFEHVNTRAKIVLIGITPGRTQMNRALSAASRAVNSQADVQQAIAEVKRIGSFSGNMRPNLVNTLNKLGYQKKLGITCCSELWAERNDLVDFCSLLTYPVFVKGRDYNGMPHPMKVPELKTMLVDEFANRLQSIPADAELVPLGELVANVLSELDDMGLVPQTITRINNKVVAPPHPSGANAESIALLLSESYPERDVYLEKMYQEYLGKRGWEKRAGGKPQSEEKYKTARASRWESMLQVRKAYGIG